MDPDAFAAETDRLWKQVEPFYKNLHCYVRARLNEKYGQAVQPRTGPIRADLLGNMWAQEWGHIYDVVAPKTRDLQLRPRQAAGQPRLHAGEDDPDRRGLLFVDGLRAAAGDLLGALAAGTAQGPRGGLPRLGLGRGRQARHPGEGLPQADRRGLQTIHHELGHNYYQRAYSNQPFLFKGAANDGFHEAIGDFAGLSAVTPTYLKQIGLIDAVPGEAEDIPFLLKMALDKIAFLPFGLLVDRWRWEVFSGEVTPEHYNEAWWKLRLQYQGLTPPGPRPADAFDPAAKYHVPANTPYTRYFLARIYQFQFQRAACEQMNWKGPLHRCSVYGQKEVGQKFNAMMELGQSQPWPQTLAVFTKDSKADASAVAAYFKPLDAWLTQQNKGEKCGW